MYQDDIEVGTFVVFNPQVPYLHSPRTHGKVCIVSSLWDYGGGINYKLYLQELERFITASREDIVKVEPEGKKSFSEKFRKFIHEVLTVYSYL